MFSSASVSSPAQYPSFRSEPASVVQSRGSVARLRCLVSPPSAVVSWRFRGLPLDQDTLPGVELNEGSLIISSLKPSHVGIYQCVAHLEHGPAIASRHAHVAIAGTDTENYPSVHSSTHFKAEGQKKRGSCLEKKEGHFVSVEHLERMPVFGCLLLSGGGEGSSRSFTRAQFQLPLDR